MKTHTTLRDERGNAVLEFACVFLLAFALITCAIFDLGRYIMAAAQVEDASYAACRALALDTSLTASDLKATAAAAAPGLTNGTLAVSRTVGGRVDEAYTHHLPSDDGGFVDRNSMASSRSVSVTVRYSYDPMTFVGDMVAKATSGSDRIDLVSTADGTADAMVEGGISTW